MLSQTTVILAIVLFANVAAGCPKWESLYNTDRVSCPQCKFQPANKAFSQSGNTVLLTCPADHELWYYNPSGVEFVAPVARIKGATLVCSGSTWQLNAGGRKTPVAAVACSKQ